MLKLLQKEFILETSRIQSERMGTVNHMKDLYDAARHLVWLTQFGLSVVLPAHARFYGIIPHRLPLS